MLKYWTHNCSTGFKISHWLWWLKSKGSLASQQLLHHQNLFIPLSNHHWNIVLPFELLRLQHRHQNLAILVKTGENYRKWRTSSYLANSFGRNWSFTLTTFVTSTPFILFLLLKVVLEPGVSKLTRMADNEKKLPCIGSSYRYTRFFWGKWRQLKS